MNKTRTLIVTVIGIVISSFFLVWKFHQYLRSDTARDTLLVETSKSIMQLVFVVALGGLLKLLFDQVAEEYQRKQKKKEEERLRQQAANAVRTNILNDLITARTGIEAVRLRYGIEESEGPAAVYKATIVSILEARVNLARIYNAVITARYLFANDEKIAERIVWMKGYLDGLIREYDNEVSRLRSLNSEDQAGVIKNLPHFGDFLSDPEKSKYGREFLEQAYRPVVKEIRVEVLRGNNVKEADLDQAQNETTIARPRQMEETSDLKATAGTDRSARKAGQSI